MTPQEKAVDLVDRFYQLTNTNSKERAKACALICCDQVLGDMGADRGHSYWTEVKAEVQKL